MFEWYSDMHGKGIGVGRRIGYEPSSEEPVCTENGCLSKSEYDKIPRNIRREGHQVEEAPVTATFTAFSTEPSGDGGG
jgi:hypothetical protein